MFKNKKILLLVTVIIIAIVMIIVFYILANQKDKIEEEAKITDISVEYDASDLSEKINEAETLIDLSNLTVTGEGAKIANNRVTISTGGTYKITGKIDDGNIIVNASKNVEVQIILSNVSITSSTTSAIFAKTAAKLIITLENGTTNYLEDGATYKYSNAEETEPDATIFTKCDLSINGDGTLEVKANYSDGIVSKDTLKIVSGNIKVTAADDGIRGKDYVTISNGSIDITAASDGIKATNVEDTTLGYVLIEGGTINIVSEQDGIQAETIVNISGGTFNIKTGGGSSNSSTSSSNWGNWGMQRNQKTSSEGTTSSKGIKGVKEITITGGTFTINSSDDSLHSNGNVIITSGTFEMASGDDGIHADSTLKIDGETIKITKSYEGLEGSYIEINGGDIYIVSSDDGLNVAGGADSSSINGRIGQNAFDEDTGQKLVITNGNIYINASGDSLDSNGSIYMSGGTVQIDGTTSGGNGILDYGGEFVLTGGELLACGTSDMMQTPSTNSTQYTISIAMSGASEDEITLKTASEEICSYKVAKTYQAIIISSAKLQKGETYDLYVNGTKTNTITISNIVTSIGGINNRMQNMQPPGGKMR